MATGYRSERAAEPVTDQGRRVSLPTSNATERSRSVRLACSTDLMPSLRLTQALISR